MWMQSAALVMSVVLISGCASEVDKCVAAWEAAYANTPNDEINRFCISDSSFKCGDEYNLPNKTKAEALAEVRMRCLRASQGYE